MANFIKKVKELSDVCLQLERSKQAHPGELPFTSAFSVPNGQSQLSKIDGASFLLPSLDLNLQISETKTVRDKIEVQSIAHPIVLCYFIPNSPVDRALFGDLSAISQQTG